MVVRIRLSRFGNKHQPFYNIIVSQARYASFFFLLWVLFPLVSWMTDWLVFSSMLSRTARDSKPLEVIGTYNPVPQRHTNLSDEEARRAKPFKDIALDLSRAKYWLGVGAQPSDPVWRLLSMVSWGASLREIDQGWVCFADCYGQAGLLETKPKRQN